MNKNNTCSQVSPAVEISSRSVPPRSPHHRLKGRLDPLGARSEVSTLKSVSSRSPHAHHTWTPSQFRRGPHTHPAAARRCGRCIRHHPKKVRSMQRAAALPPSRRCLAASRCGHCCPRMPSALLPRATHHLYLLTTARRPRARERRDARQSAVSTASTRQTHATCTYIRIAGTSGMASVARAHDRKGAHH